MKVVAGSVARGWAPWFGAWLLAAIVLGAALGSWRWVERSAETRTVAERLYQAVSQRIDQHDAHLTALAALAAASDPPPLDLMRTVADSILQFYPRVVAVDLIEPSAATPVLFTTRATAADADAGRRAVADRPPPADRRSGIVVAPGRPDAYLVAKRIAEAPRPRWLLMEIDLARLVEIAGDGGPALPVTLTLTDGTLLHRAGATAANAFVRPTVSASQPMLLAAGTAPGPADVVDAALIGLSALVAAVLVGLAALLGAARSAERAALARARIGETEARLAHALRVNALGEMASGLAHELTQPVAAILAQAQAGRHLARRLGPQGAELMEVLEACVRQSRRAGDILGRLRAWIVPGEPERRPTDLAAVAGRVVELLGRELGEAGVAVDIRIDTEGAVAAADPVEIEQVVFNLVRNAAEAVAELPAPRRIAIRVAREAGSAIVEVADDGPGIPAADAERIFEPFFTTKAGGTGLGLALSRRIVERHGGRLTLQPRPGGGTLARLGLDLATGQHSDRDADREAAQ